MGSWLFDGVDDFMSIPDSAAQQSLSTAGTWGGWIAPNGINDAFAGWIQKVDSTGSQDFAYAIAAGNNSDDPWARSVLSVNSTFEATNYYQAFTNDTWYFIVATFDGSELLQRIWNAAGTQVSTLNHTGISGSITYDTTDDLRICRGSGSNYYGCRTAYLGATDTELSDADITKWRTTGYPPGMRDFSSFFMPLDSASGNVDVAQGGTVTTTGAVYDSNVHPPVSVRPALVRASRPPFGALLQH